MTQLLGYEQGAFQAGEPEVLNEPSSAERARNIFDWAGGLPNLSPFERAFVVASRLHANQKRKGSEVPYMRHLLGVASLVLQGGGGETPAIAALLHDSVEDQHADPADIEALFGRIVADIVMGCTDVSENEAGVARDAKNSLQRKAAYREKLANEKDLDIRLVSAADKLHNARSTLEDLRRDPDEAFGKFNVSREETLNNYRLLVDVLRTPPVVPLVDEYAKVVDELLNEAGA